MPLIREVEGKINAVSEKFTHALGCGARVRVPSHAGAARVKSETRVCCLFGNPKGPISCPSPGTFAKGARFFSLETVFT